jgi:hypothetical protein
MQFPLHHPPAIERDVEMDDVMERILLDQPSLIIRAYRKIKALVT